MRTERLGVVIAPRFYLRDRDHLHPHYLYLIRNADQVLYAGKSRMPAVRVKEHIYNRHRDPIGLHIHEQRPASLEWMVDFMTLLDLGSKVRSDQLGFADAINKAERQLIARYQPPFNCERSRHFRFSD